MNKSLRQQITEIGAKYIGSAYVESAGFTRTVSALAEKAFIEQWKENWETRAIRQCCILLLNPGWVTEDEPASEEID